MVENKLFDLTGKKALVTGGGQGLGLAIAKALTKAGATVMIIGRNEEALQCAAKTLGENCHYRVFDFGKISAIPIFAEQLEKDFGPIDILVNNAGINLKKEVLDVTDEDFSRIISINQQAVFALTREVCRNMAARKTGSVIMISSMASQYGIPKVIAYTASKSAVEGMTRALAVELSPMGIRVNCIAPGFIETEMSAKALNNDKERMQKVLSRTPMGKLGKPDDIGHAAVFLALGEVSYVTGVVLPVDAGNAIGF